LYVEVAFAIVDVLYYFVFLIYIKNVEGHRFPLEIYSPIRQVSERCAGATIRRYVMTVLSGKRGACIVCVCVWSPPSHVGGFSVPRLRPSSLECVLLPLPVRGQGFGGDV
jgi:hypothetical protein